MFEYDEHIFTLKEIRHLARWAEAELSWKIKIIASDMFPDVLHIQPSHGKYEYAICANGLPQAKDRIKELAKQEVISRLTGK